MAETAAKTPAIEWPTLGLLVVCYLGWAVATTWIAALWLPLGVVATAVFIALHSSLTHEVLHGHPFRSAILNELVIFPCLCLMIPYQRFRDQHLAHHRDSLLTDPYDDPESNFYDPKVWRTLSAPMKVILRFNNTLLGRMLIGVAVGQVAFFKDEWAAARAGDQAVRKAWAWQILAVIPVLWWVWTSPMPIWAYLIASYIGLSVIKIRTFLEHRAHERASGRTVIVEDRGPLAWIFLNNNLHVVHHMHPKVAWYDLPALYDSNRRHYQTRNDGYIYQSYADVFRKYFLRTKDPVPHPLMKD